MKDSERQKLIEQQRQREQLRKSLPSPDEILKRKLEREARRLENHN